MTCPPFLRRLLAAAAVVVPAAAGLTAASLPAAAASSPASGSANAFYVPPDPLPPGKPGDVIRYRSFPSPVPGASAW
ncbi:MAG: hypothetical protein J2P27_18555, partial [Actinobacteria bacterium]|nr:hypothetical protein [Actinomycetota bacterium]